ncbi:MAG: MATE family efflux transporter [Bacteroidales bacterium]|nr:MATE family efflux transporter [Bacteroidales bacterium]
MSISAAPTELGTEKISKLLQMYAVPGIIAMTASSLYNMVDSIFIGHIPEVGALAISGLAVTFPLTNLSVALGTLVGVGASTMVSVLLGQKNYGKANRVLGNVMTLNTILGVVFASLCFCFLEPILEFFGASESTMPFAKEYISIILLGNVVTHLYFGLNGSLRASGHPKTAMGLTIFTVTSNVILDPIFIFTLGMGIKGAALATVICQTIALALTLKFFLDERHVVHLEKRLFSLDWKIAKSSLAIGLGPFLMNCASCIVAIFINQQLRRYGGDLAIGSYGIANRITFMFVMVNIGLNQGMQPIAGYNYGARLYRRVKKIFTLTAIWEICVTSLCFVISVFLPRTAASLFTNDPELMIMAAHALKIMNSGFALVGFGMVSSNLFQCLGMVNKSIFLSLSRQLLFFVPLVYLLPMRMNENGVWLSFPISDILSILVSAVFVIALFKKLGRLKDGEDPSVLGSSI